MKSYLLAFVLAVLVVLTGMTLRHSVAGIGGTDPPLPPSLVAIGGTDPPLPPALVR